MIDYTIILTRKYPNDQWILNGDEYAGLEWLSDTPKPTKKTLDDLHPVVMSEIEAEKDAKDQQKAAILAKLGITAEELATALG
jgi:hypothetical protein